MIIMLFCKLCQRLVDWKHVHTCKDHLWFNAHTKNKEKHCSEKEFQQKKTEESNRKKIMIFVNLVTC